METKQTPKIVAFVDVFYGTPKGHSYVNRDLLNIIGENCETHMYRLGNNPLTPEFPLPSGRFDSYQGVQIPKQEFEQWLDEVKPDFCVFNEYNQWFGDKVTYDKLDVCRARGIKTIGFLVWEKLDWTKINHYKKYTKIIVPSGFQTKLMRKKGLYNTVHIKWGASFKEIDSVIQPTRNQKVVTFYHCAGSGGVGDRKNTDKVIEAYKQIQGEDTNLIITHLGSKVFTRQDIISFMKGSDVLINTSKWDTIGLNNIEANICGIPVITTNAPPMNELIVNNMNGLLVDADEGVSPQVTCPSFDVHVDDLAKKMNILRNRIILETLQSNARKFAETNFDWDKNKQDIQKLFR